MRKPVRSRRTRSAGFVGDQEYGVTTIEGGEGYCRRPCESCPWRSDLPTGVFPAEAFRLSAGTAYDMAQNQFACHMQKPESPKTCAGFLLRGAAHNLGVRLGQIMGKIDMRKVSDAGLPLYESYRDMAEANGVDSHDPVLDRCR